MCYNSNTPSSSTANSWSQPAPRFFVPLLVFSLELLFKPWIGTQAVKGSGC
ncbi:hypothetical protein IM043_gp231 [Bacillus phage SPG24]|uniref:hypothetical protein n=1 Tax=Bacillus phage SPG24 TaxID=1497851 RepID=UPI0022BA3FB6|nr:hypothetical protein IM043_gp231 [Bacillus phage SPG24]